MKTFYSQHGQDFIVSRCIKKPTSMIEVGCIDGLVISNTYYFEKNFQTKCYLFEPHKDYADLIRKNRPKSEFREYAISNIDNDEGEFFQNFAGTFSNLTNEFENLYNKSSIFGGYEKVQNVKIRTLNSCINELNINSIDFLSIDIEGNDILALEGMDFYNILPTITCIEMGDSLLDCIKYSEYFKQNSKYKYFLILQQDFFAFKYFRDYVKSIFLFKRIKLLNHRYPFEKSKTDLLEKKIIIFGPFMLHRYLKLKNIKYRRFIYRLKKVISIISKS